MQVSQTQPDSGGRIKGLICHRKGRDWYMPVMVFVVSVFFLKVSWL